MMYMTASSTPLVFHYFWKQLCGVSGIEILQGTSFHDVFSSLLSLLNIFYSSIWGIRRIRYAEL